MYSQGGVSKHNSKSLDTKIDDSTFLTDFADFHERGSARKQTIRKKEGKTVRTSLLDVDQMKD